MVYLKDSPYIIDTALNGEEAVKKCKDKIYDIVLMDIQMPVLDGFEATKQIREWEKSQNLPQVPIVALTAYALKEEQNKCIEVGCTSHMAKPITKRELLELIGQLTGIKRS